MTDPTPTLVDSNIWIDVFGADLRWGPWARKALADCVDGGGVCINPIIYAEVSVSYDTIEELDRALDTVGVERDLLPYGAAFLAGKAFALYRKRGGQKRSPLADFYIGAHAAICGYRLLTRDTTRYQTYFPKLDVVGPD
ncbi:type II toxin-antitoxin system VapC family toxin [Glycomyces sp. A-F 0318]|uniref:type II toxin-antitoxin system VapC family toxin n=1 Tax=Glycomyces amatae TaxID=2881355 RepID=UPI001E51F291|nr:type II toxin-antitoxin system VapC family toxin [Glycomyces amatae]MCD0447380.1 type II toxin-antitoxin system VapC family toxin [Glycomyces amatae]